MITIEATIQFTCPASQTAQSVTATSAWIEVEDRGRYGTWKSLEVNCPCGCAKTYRVEV